MRPLRTPTGPELAAARTELVAAIDDLDAQARALLPPGGSATRDPVQLDPTRILAAAAEIERLCGSAPAPARRAADGVRLEPCATSSSTRPSGTP